LKVQSVVLMLTLVSAHLSGENFLAFSPYHLLEFWVAKMLNATRVPFGTMMGDWPSLPPPRGRVVISVQNLPLRGTGGNSLSAVSTDFMR
jgi:hypothetical protein